jgi:polyisoprenyl-phosphate glycosyltransferase
MSQSKPDYSIVIPVFFNEGSLKPLFQRLYTEVIKAHEWKAEIIFIDDGSGDNSFNKLMELYNEYAGLVKIIKLTRNFGQVPAIIAGLQIAKGDCIIWTSADLQDSPSLISEMLIYYFKEEYEIVICHRKSRDESWFRRISSVFFMD